MLQRAIIGGLLEQGPVETGLQDGADGRHGARPDTQVAPVGSVKAQGLVAPRHGQVAEASAEALFGMWSIRYHRFT